MNEVIMFINLHYLNGSDYDTPFWEMATKGAKEVFEGTDPSKYNWDNILDGNPQFIKKMFDNFLYVARIYREVHVSLIMTKFLLPFAIKIIDAAVDKIPDDLEDQLKKFVIGLLKKAAAKSGNKVDDQLVEALEKALFE